MIAETWAQRGKISSKKRLRKKLIPLILRVEAWCKVYGYELKLDPYIKGMGQFAPMTRCISIHPNLEARKFVVVLYHEWAHAWLDQSGLSSGEGDVPTWEDTINELSEEFSAWAVAGNDLATVVSEKTKLWKVFNEVKQNCLKVYITCAAKEIVERTTKKRLNPCRNSVVKC